MGELEGRTALVTGAGRGLGRAHALLLASLGAKVVVNDVGVTPAGEQAAPDPADEVAAEIRANGGEAISSFHDISSWDQAAAAVDTAINVFGSIDVVVNNAGVARHGGVATAGGLDWDLTLGVHVKGTAAVTHWAARHWKERKAAGHPVKASVINTSSVAGLLGLGGEAAYSAAKAAVLNLTLVSAVELAPLGARVNAICPAARTRLSDDWPEMQAPTDGRLDRFNPNLLAPVVAYLASADCPVTGQVLSVMGDWVTVHAGWTSGLSVRPPHGTGWTFDSVRAALAELPLVDHRLHLQDRLTGVAAPSNVNDNSHRLFTKPGTDKS